MSREDGWAAINLQKTARVPRTEYSAGGHWELIRAVTGADVSVDSPDEKKGAATRLFMSSKHWNYDFSWNILIHNQYLEAKRTDMGHAVYAAGGVDKRAASGCPFASPDEVYALDFFETYGRLKHADLVAAFNRHYQQASEGSPEAVPMTGIYVTMISGLLEIFGWDMFLEALGEDPEAMGKVAQRYGEWAQQFFEAMADCDAPIVMVHDDIVWTSGAFVAPAWYRSYVFPAYKKYFAPLHEAGKKIAYTSDGNYTEFIHDIAACGVNGFVMEPTTDMSIIARDYGKTHFFIGNADTRILLSGTKAQIRTEVERCMNIGKECPGFFMAVGNHIPSNTPVENAIYYNEAYTELSRR